MGADVFQYALADFGNDVITGYGVDSDYFEVSSNIAASFDDISVEQVRNHTIIQMGDGSITLSSTLAFTITEDDFVFT